jgi:hypothetical protein
MSCFSFRRCKYTGGFLNYPNKNSIYFSDYQCVMLFWGVGSQRANCTFLFNLSIDCLSTDCFVLTTFSMLVLFHHFFQKKRPNLVGRRDYWFVYGFFLPHSNGFSSATCSILICFFHCECKYGGNFGENKGIEFGLRLHFGKLNASR